MSNKKMHVDEVDTDVSLVRPSPTYLQHNSRSGHVAQVGMPVQQFILFTTETRRDAINRVSTQRFEIKYIYQP